MNKKWLRRILAMAMVFSLAAGSWVTGYADDGEGNIVISGDGVYEVEAGKTTKIELQVKNKGTGTAENVNLQPRVSSGVAPFRVKMQGNGDLGDMGANAYKKVTLQVTVGWGCAGAQLQPAHRIYLQQPRRQCKKRLYDDLFENEGL